MRTHTQQYADTYTAVFGHLYSSIRTHKQQYADAYGGICRPQTHLSQSTLICPQAAPPPQSVTPPQQTSWRSAAAPLDANKGIP